MDQTHNTIPPKPLTIEQVENGFIVTNSFNTEMRYPSMSRDGELTYEKRTPRVFRSLAELTHFIGNHFTHRELFVEPDTSAET